MVKGFAPRPRGGGGGGGGTKHLSHIEKAAAPLFQKERRKSITVIKQDEEQEFTQSKRKEGWNENTVWFSFRLNRLKENQRIISSLNLRPEPPSAESTAARKLDQHQKHQPLSYRRCCSGNSPSLRGGVPLCACGGAGAWRGSRGVRGSRWWAGWTDTPTMPSGWEGPGVAEQEGRGRGWPLHPNLQQQS